MRAWIAKGVRPALLVMLIGVIAFVALAQASEAPAVTSHQEVRQMPTRLLWMLTASRPMPKGQQVTVRRTEIRCPRKS